MKITPTNKFMKKNDPRNIKITKKYADDGLASYLGPVATPLLSTTVFIISGQPS